MGDRAGDLEAAMQAVRAASRACRAVQQRLVRPETLEKKDKSPVTVADFTSQAIVCARLAECLPGDRVVGEENAAALREGAQAALRAAVVERVGEALGGDPDAERILGWIDLGAAEASGARFWTLDPIDGTKGFLRGAQYAVVLALIEEGEVVLGVLGCPNLPVDGGVGALFTAIRGEPAYVHDLWDADAAARPISVGGMPASPRCWASVRSPIASTASASTRRWRATTRRSTCACRRAPITARRSGTTPRESSSSSRPAEP
jgi:3'(2'), 5'-bisphosphate nucleotidase